MSAEKLTLPETVKPWNDFEIGEQFIIIEMHRAAFKAHDIAVKDADVWYRVFELGKPFIVVGGDFEYCRVDQQSITLMNMLTKEYLLGKDLRKSKR